MAGFGKVTLLGEYFNQKIVNVLWYRSDTWVPNQGNPFDDVQAFVNAVWAGIQTHFLACLSGDYTLQTVEGVGYDNSFNIITASPIMLTVGLHGSRTALPSNGASPCAIIDLRCSDQVQINGTGHSKRNRGYVAIGPLGDTDIDSYSHIESQFDSALTSLGGDLKTSFTILSPAVNLIPIRIHQKYQNVLGAKVLAWRTYSDIQGFAVRRVASFRRSRIPEA